jgi:hypothetical protein
VRIEVHSVEVGQVKATDGTAGAQALNQQRLENARAIYGPYAEFWLGLQDTCKMANVPCVVNVGGNGSVSVPSP